MKIFLNCIRSNFVVVLILLLNSASFFSVKESAGQTCKAIPEISLDTVCGGVTVTFTDKSNFSSGFGNSDWFFGDGDSVKGSPNVSREYELVEVDTTYFITLKITDLIDTDCHDDSIIPIRVLARPKFDFFASDTSACVANDTILFSTSLSTPEDYSYLWFFGDGKSSVDPSPKHSFSSIGFYDISLIVTDSRGCNTTNEKEDFVKINVNPTVSIKFNGSIVGCSPHSVEIINNTKTTGQNIVEWLWNFGDGQTSTDKDPGTLTFTNLTLKDTLYGVKLTAKNENGCFASTSSVVKIKHNPTADFTVTSPICAEENASVTYTGSAPANATYNWFFLDGTISSGSGQGPLAVNWPSGGIRDLTLTVIENGCSSEVETVPVDVNPIPTTLIEVTDSGCLNKDAIIEYIGSAGPNAIFNWNFDVGSSPGSANSRGPHNVSWNSIGNKTIELSVVDSGCGSDLGKYNLEIFPNPTATFSNPSPVCNNDTSSIFYTGTANSTAKFEWQFDDASFIEGSGIGPYKVRWNSAGLKKMYLQVTEDGCISEIDSNEIIVNPAPTNSFVVPPSTCLRDTTEITYLGTGAISAIYNWNFDGATIISGSGQGPFKIKWLSPGEKTITLQVIENNCALPTDTQKITVIEEPTASFSGKTSICLNENNLITYNGTASSSAIYNWNFDNGTIISGSGQGPYEVNWIADGSGSKKIRLKVTEFGCTSLEGTLNVEVNKIPDSHFVTNSNELCSSDTLIVEYSGSSAASATYNWNFESGSILSGSDKGPLAIKWLDNPGIKNISLTVIENGCVSLKSTKLITVHDLPNIILSSNDEDNIICDGDSVTFKVMPNDLVTYEFLKNNVSVQNNISNKYRTKDLVNADILTSVGVDSNGCKSPISNSIELTVNPIPVVSLTSSDSNDTICEGTSVTFSALPTGLENYKFLDGSVILQDGSNNIYLSDSLIKGNNITVIGMSKNCYSLPSNKVSTELIAPLSKPVINCGNSGLDSIQFIWNEIDRAQGYQISFNNGATWENPSSGILGLEHIANGLSPEDELTAIIRALGGAPCGNSAPSDTLTCYARACTAISLIASKDTAICLGDSAKLRVSKIKTVGNYSLSWNNGSATLDSSLVVSPSNNTNIKVVLVDSAQLVCPSFNNTFNIEVNPLPFVVLTSSDNDNIACEGDSILFKATEDFPNYEFFLNLTSAQNSSSNIFKIEASEPKNETYTIATNVYGCRNSSNTIETIVKPAPITNLENNDDNDTLCLGQTVTFTANGNFDAFHFYVQDTLAQAGSNHQFITSQLADKDSVYVIAYENGCAGPSSNTIKFTVLVSPTVSLSNSLSGDSLCLGDTIIFSATPNNLVKYDFYKNNELIQSDITSSIQITEFNAGDFMNVIGYNSNGCPSYNNNTIYPTVVTPLETPVVNCGNSTPNSVEFVWDSIVNSTGYEISLDNGTTWLTPSSGNEGLMHSVTGLNQGDLVNIKVKALGNTVCGNSNVSETTTCSAFICNAINFNTSGDTSICEGNSVDIKISDINTINYEVSWNDGAFGSDTTFHVNPIGDSIISVAVRDTTQKLCPVAKKMVKIKYNLLIELQLTSSDIDNSICKGDFVEFMAKPSGLSNYKFYKDFVLVQDSDVNQFFDYELLNGEEIKVKGVDPNGCESLESNGIIINVETALTKPLVNCGNSTPSSVEFVWDDVENNMGYQISLDGGLSWMNPSSGEFGQNHQISGLSQDEIVSILVQAKGNEPCGNSLISDTVSCAAILCEAIDFEITRDTSICAGQTVELVISHPSPINYSISWNESAYGSDLDFLITTTKDSIIIVRMIDSTQLLCPALKKEVNINTNPLPKVQLKSSDNNNSICEGDVITFTATANYSNYVFYYNSTVLQDSIINLFTTSDLIGNGNINVVATNKFGCSSLSNSISSQVVKPLSKPVVNCGTTSEGTISFVWDPVDDATGYEVSINGANWEKPSSGNSGLLHLIDNLNHGDIKNISVHALGVDPCGNSIPSDTISCIAENCKLVDFKINPKDTTICKGKQVNIKVNDISATTYSIIFNDQIATTNTSLSLTPPNDTIIKIELIDSLQIGCATTIKYTKIQVNPIPEITLSSIPNGDTICSGMEVQFACNPSGIGNYEFYNNGVLVQNSSSNTFNTNGLIKGNKVFVIAQNIYGCWSKPSDSKSFEIVSPLNSPLVNCGSSTPDSINFVWDLIADAASYEISLDNGVNWSIPSSGIGSTHHGIGNLNSGDEVAILVRAIGNTVCGNSLESNLTACKAIQCNAISFKLPRDTSVCFNDTIGLIAEKINIPKYGLSWNNGPYETNKNYQFVATKGIKVFALLIDSTQLLCPAYYQETDVTVNILPNLTLNSATIQSCVNEEINLEVFPQELASYEFFLDDNLILTSSNSKFSVSLKNSGNFKMSAIGKNSIGCTTNKSNIIDFEVKPLPIVAATSSVNEICVGNDLELTGTGAINYNWEEIKSPGTSIGSGKKITVKPGITSSYLLIGEGINGCFGSDTITIQVNSLPQTKIFSLQDSICIGDTLTLSGTGAKNYSWFNLSINTNLGNSEDISIGPVSTTSYELTGVDSNNCLNKDTITISVLEAVTLGSSKDTICASDEVTLMAFGGLNFEWFDVSQPDIILGTGNNLVIQPTKTSTFEVRANNGNCKSAQSLKIEVNQPPVLNIEGNDSLCFNQITTLFANGASTYKWTNLLDPGTVLSESDSLNTQLTITTQYLIIGTDSNFCSNKDTAQVWVRPSLNVDAGNDLALCEGEQLEMQGIFNGNGKVSWSPEIGLSNANISNPILQLDSTRMYTFTVTDSKCTESDTLLATLNPCFDGKITIPTLFTPNGDGKNDQWVIPEIGLYPNCEVQIFNRWGNLIYEMKGYDNSWDGTNQIRKTKLSEGTYFYVLILNDSLKTPAYTGYVTIMR